MKKKITQKANYVATVQWHFKAPRNKTLDLVLFHLAFCCQSNLVKFQFGCNSSSDLQKQGRTLEG